MKKIFYYALTLFITLLFRCSPEEESIDPQNEKIQFSVAVSDDNSGGRTKDLPEGASLMISIANNSGPVATNQRINLLKIGDSYITEPFELTPGTYFITDFMILSGSEVLYATPKRGSPLAPYVEKALPSYFNVKRDQNTNVDMQVISVDQRAPEHFGYVSFGIDIVQPLQIAVFKAQEGGAVLTPAHGEIFDGEDLVQEFSLEPKTNTIYFTGDAAKTYTLKIRTEGAFEIYTRDFNYQDLIGELNGKPLKVILHPAFAVKINVAYYDVDTPFDIMLDGEGEVVITGAPEFAGTYRLPVEFEDVDLGEGDHYLSITGDIDQITEFNSFSYNGGVETVDGLEYLTSLERFDPGINFEDPSLDFSNNTRLRSVSLFWVILPNWFTLPEDHQISQFSLEAFSESEPRVVTGEELDEIINNIYENAVEKNIESGVLYIAHAEYISDLTDYKLDQLREVYNWEAEVYLAE